MTVRAGISCSNPGWSSPASRAFTSREENVGIRIEDDILITEKGPVNLTEKIVKDPARIELLMK